MERGNAPGSVRSKQGQVILEELRGTMSHPRGDELYIMVRKRLPNVSLGTVYRNLDRLRREGSALEIYCGDFVRYDGNVAPHDHFLCRGCRRVWDYAAPGDEEHAALVGVREDGFRVDGRYVIYYGRCPDCQP